VGGTLAVAFPHGVRLLVRGVGPEPLSRSDAEPYRHLLLRLFGKSRRPSAKARLRRTRAELARLAGWVPESSTDAEALQRFKGRGARAKLVRLEARLSWPLEMELRLSTIPACCRWIDYLRDRGIRTEADLAGDLTRVGIVGTEPAALFARLSRSLVAIEHELRLSASDYQRARERLGRIVLGVLRCNSKNKEAALEAVKKLLRRGRAHRKVRVVRVDPDFARDVSARLDASARAAIRAR
jgi:hypothetical protein